MQATSPTSNKFNKQDARCKPVEPGKGKMQAQVPGADADATAPLWDWDGARRWTLNKPKLQ
jgi:hypothetical protein